MIYDVKTGQATYGRDDALTGLVHHMSLDRLVRLLAEHEECDRKGEVIAKLKIDARGVEIQFGRAEK